jgi:hypothetical protein
MEIIFSDFIAKANFKIRKNLSFFILEDQSYYFFFCWFKKVRIYSGKTFKALLLKICTLNILFWEFSFTRRFRCKA